MSIPRSLVELRVLDGPNQHFLNPTVQLRLDVAALLDAPPEVVAAHAEEVGLALPEGPPDGAGEAGSDRRRTVLHAWLKHVARHLASLDGVDRLAVAVGPGHTPAEAVVAFPWSREGRARLLGEWIAWTVDDVGEMPLADTFAEAADRLSGARPGPGPMVVAPTVPTVAVTGTNGKTTTTRLVAHLLMTAGMTPAWTSTDGLYRAAEPTGAPGTPRRGVLVEAGDWAGFSGAGRALETPGIDVAVLEVARGGILRRGMGVTTVDVGVVTNVTADHMGELGVHTLEDLARVKSTVVRSIADDGCAVLNAEDPLVAAMRRDAPRRVTAFAVDPLAPRLQELAEEGATAVTVEDGVIVLRTGETTPVAAVVDVPLTLRGLATHNVANALAAVGVADALGIGAEVIADGLRSFRPDAVDNPGRLNLYRRDDVLLLADIAHNVDSLRALCTVARGLAGDGRVLLITGTLGDREPGIITDIGRVSVEMADVAVIAEKQALLRGRDAGEVVELLNRGATAAGGPPLPVHPDEIVALDALLPAATGGDVVVLAVHEARGDIGQHLAARGFAPAHG